ncbi:MAG: hypothetical protein ACRCT1_02555 [Microcoleaceae cyanobacterium]
MALPTAASKTFNVETIAPLGSIPQTSTYFRRKNRDDQAIFSENFFPITG